MNDAEARKIFDLQLPLCETLGLDVRRACLDAGVPRDLVDRLMAEDRALTRAVRACVRDPAVLASAGARGSAADNVGFACLAQEVTGLPMILWAMTGTPSTAAPYIRVQSNHAPVPDVAASARLSVEPNPRLMSGDLPPADLCAVTAFVRRNREALLDQWNGVAKSPSLVQRLVRSP